MSIGDDDTPSPEPPDPRQMEIPFDARRTTRLRTDPLGIPIGVRTDITVPVLVPAGSPPPPPGPIRHYTTPADFAVADQLRREKTIAVALEPIKAEMRRLEERLVAASIADAEIKGQIAPIAGNVNDIRRLFIGAVIAAVVAGLARWVIS